MTLLHTLGRSFPQYQFGVSYDGTLGHESYSVDHFGHIFSIRAGSPLAKYFALSRLQAALEGKHVQVVLDVLEPRFPVRPLFITSAERCRLPSKLTVDLPLWFRDVGEREDLLLEKTHDLLLYAFELGVNTLVFTSSLPDRETSQSTITWKQLRLFLDQIKDTGMKIGLHMLYPSSEKEVCDRVKEFAQSIHVLYDVIDFVVLHQEEILLRRTDRTEYEEAKEEIRLVEAQIRKPLVYLLHSKDLLGCKHQASWMTRLSQEIGPNTILLFHAVAGKPFHFGCHLHPFFAVCSMNDVRSHDKIMPFFSLSEFVLKDTNKAVPFVASNLVEEIFGRQNSDHLYGIGLMLKEIAPIDSLSRIAQWCYGQKMWGDQSVQALFCEGITRFFQAWHIKDNQGLFRQLYFELDQLIRQYGSFMYGIFLQESSLQDRVELRKIEHMQLCLQIEIFALYLRKSILDLSEQEREKLKSLSQFLSGVQHSILRVIHEEAQNYSLKIPAHIATFKIVEL